MDVQQQVNKNTGIFRISRLTSAINNGKSGLVQQADKDAAITVGKNWWYSVNVAGNSR